MIGKTDEKMRTSEKIGLAITQYNIVGLIYT